MPAATIGADEMAHILDNAKNRHIHLAEHVEALARVNQRQILRCRHNHRTRQRRPLRECQLRIACSRRHVDDQHIKIVPCDIAQHLLDRAHHHRPPPDCRRVLGHQIADRHGLQAPRLNRLDLLAIGLRLDVLADQPWQRWPIDIRIQNANALACRGNRQRKVDRGCRFANTTLARSHGNQMFGRFVRRVVRLCARACRTWPTCRTM